MLTATMRASRMHLLRMPPPRRSPPSSGGSAVGLSFGSSSSSFSSTSLERDSGNTSSSGSVTTLAVFLLILLLRTMGVELRPASSSLLLEFVAAGCCTGKTTFNTQNVILTQGFVHHEVNSGHNGLTEKACTVYTCK